MACLVDLKSLNRHVALGKQSKIVVSHPRRSTNYSQLPTDSKPSTLNSQLSIVNYQFDYMSDLNHKTILVTGSAGFIGANLVKRLFTEMSDGTIIGLDNLNNYYDVSLKEYRLKELDTYYSQLTNAPLPLNSKPSTLNYFPYLCPQNPKRATKIQNSHH